MMNLEFILSTVYFCFHTFSAYFIVSMYIRDFEYFKYIFNTFEHIDETEKLTVMFMCILAPIALSSYIILAYRYVNYIRNLFFITEHINK